MRNVHKISVGKNKGRDQLGIPRHRWLNNIKADINAEGQ
jgi:hypothetical protein